MNAIPAETITAPIEDEDELRICDECGEPFAYGWDCCMEPECWKGYVNIADEMADRMYHSARGH